MSSFGSWTARDGLPVFRYVADPAVTPAAEWDPVVAPRSRRHSVVLGNRRVNALVDNLGSTALFDEYDGLRFITAPDPAGTGESLVNGASLVVRSRELGPTWLAVTGDADGLEVTRTVMLPEGEQPWLLIGVTVRNPGVESRAVEHVEQWTLRPRSLNLFTGAELTRENAAAAVRFVVTAAGGRVVAQEERTPEAKALAERPRAQSFGALHTVVLEAAGSTNGVAGSRQLAGEAHPTLEVVTSLHLEPGEATELWFRFGLDDGATLEDPAPLAARWRTALHERLPRATAAAAPSATREIPWHAALLTGGACVDGVLGGHTLDQGSTYSYHWGFNGAARDPLQHALPLVYSEPDLALSVLRNTCAWAGPDGDLPYGLDGAKQPWTDLFDPSDQNLWALWLAAEYAAATGDLAAFDQPVGFHPVHRADPATLGENLRRQFDFLVHGVGLGEHGHLRIMNADWNDVAISTSGVPHEQMIEKGESVLNSAMAAWVLPVYAGLCDRLGDASTAVAARRFGEQLRQAVAGEWNGRWFRRAYGPGAVVGEDDLWLENQPWAILCGAASDDQAAQLLETIDQGPRSASPLGARVRWPVGGEDGAGIGEATNGGIWYAINATLIWAAARLDPALAWDEWRRMSPSAHEAAYPDVWEGTLSGPDAYNSPESSRAGRTWAIPSMSIGMQSFPVGNLHSHGQPLLSYLRLLGVEPAADGALRVRGATTEAGARFESRSFAVEADGSGRLTSVGEVTVDTGSRRVTGTGALAW